MTKAHQKWLRIKTEYGEHAALLESDKKGYIVTVPALEGVITWGRSIAHAQKMAKEAIELCIESLVGESVVRDVGRALMTKRGKTPAGA